MSVAKGDTLLEQIVDPEIQLEARYCSEIVNKLTGNSWMRDLDPRSRWTQLYHHAKMHEKIFELVMEEAPPTVMEVEGETGLEKRTVFNMFELEGSTMKKLQEIGKMYGVKANRKKDLILMILNEQSRMVLKARPEHLPTV